MILPPGSSPHTSLCYTFPLVLCFFALSTASTAVITVTVTASPSSPSYLSPPKFRHAILAQSNAYRRRHNARPLVWNEYLADYALNWARKCMWKHSNGPYGENLAYGFPNASAAVSAWGDEAQQYNYYPPTGFTEQTGHFTQLVWRSTTDVGCAAVDCGYPSSDSPDQDHRRANGWFVVCEYWPAGNVVGRNKTLFMLNVLPSTVRRNPLVSHTSNATEVETASSWPTSSSTWFGLDASGGWVWWLLGLCWCFVYLLG
ncbi:hypothetical protein PHISP_00505 [Aspergillus sp. HF37]|nr:hypothetical protein PHISP_00505 [Aspergillus sp. HF37]